MANKNIAIVTAKDGTEFTLVFFEDNNINNEEFSITGSYSDLKRILMDGVNAMDENFVTITTKIKIKERN